MQIYDQNKQKIGILHNFRNRTISTTLSSGDKEMSFEYDANGPMVDCLIEENYIQTREDEFVIKAVEKGDTFNKYTCTLNVEELEGTPYMYGFETQEKTIRECLTFAFEDTGWTVRACDIKKKRTIDIQESTTAWGVLQKALETYRVECLIDSINKCVDIYERIGSNRGAYIMEGVNLRKLTLKSDTYDFYTRIYPVGKDGITPRVITGKDYIDNNQYSTKVKAFAWKDERYTNTVSLIEDATAKLEEVSKPYKAFTAQVIDLAKISDKYSVLDYSIGDEVVLVSRSMRTRERQRIVKIVEYPEAPEKNTIEISNAKKTFAEIQREATQQAAEESVEISNRNVKKTLDGYTEEITTRLGEFEGEIRIEVDKKVNEDEIISKINVSSEKIQIESSKINLKAADIINIIANNEINLSTKKIRIKADNLEVTDTGSAKLKDVEITGGSIKMVTDAESPIRITSVDGYCVTEISSFGMNMQYKGVKVIDIPTAVTAPYKVNIGDALYLGRGSIQIHGDGGTPDTFSVGSTGDVYCKSVYQWSDEDLKKDIAPLGSDTVQFIYSLEPVEYRFRANQSNRLHHGLVAQDVKKKMGEKDWGVYVDRSLKDKEKGGKALRYEELIADIIVTLQSQNVRLRRLEET